MAAHAEYALACACISQILNLPLTIPASETGSAECLITSEDSEILDLVAACVAAVCAIVAYEGAVAKEQQVRIGVEECTAGVAAEAIYMPAVASKLESFAFFEDLSTALAWIHGVGLFHRRLWVADGRLDGGRHVWEAA